jgi:hypothetical protein
LAATVLVVKPVSCDSNFLVFPFFLFLALFVASATDNMSLPLVSPIFGDNLVLQRDKPICFWGWAIAARYAWQANPAATLFNGKGLPAVPFRTDNRPGMTENHAPW